MKTKKIVALVALMVMLWSAACPRLPVGEKGQLKTVTETWAAVKQSLDDAWRAGKLSRSEKITVMTWVSRGDRALKAWRESLRRDGEAANHRQRFMRALDIVSAVWRDVSSRPPDSEEKDPTNGSGTNE